MRRCFVHTQTTDTFLPAIEVVLMKEAPGVTGIYERTSQGLRPARTVSDDNPNRDKILSAWTDQTI